jgi:hypothetical protein
MKFEGKSDNLEVDIGEDLIDDGIWNLKEGKGKWENKKNGVKRYSLLDEEIDGDIKNIGRGKKIK